jgi:DNA-binding IclR family transcriptional regulator
MSERLNKRQLDILRALNELGGHANTNAIADQAGLNTNGVAQSLNTLRQYVRYLGRQGGKSSWELIKMPDEPVEAPKLEL